MGRITITPDDIIRRISTIEGAGEGIYNSMVTVYDTIENMHKNWHGERYYNVITTFNQLVEGVNSMIDAIGEVSVNLAKAVNNYVSADAGTIRASANPISGKVSTMTIPNDEDIDFEPNAISADLATVNNKFTEIRNRIDEIESNINSMQWESAGADRFRSAFKDAKAKIEENMTTLNKEITKYIEESKEAYNKADNSIL